MDNQKEDEVHDLASFAAYQIGDKYTVALIRSERDIIAPCKAVYSSKVNESLVIDVVVLYNTELGRITVSCSDKQIDCLQIMRGSFGSEAIGSSVNASSGESVKYEFSFARFLFWDICVLLDPDDKSSIV